jgi:hypothetical protein
MKLKTPFTNVFSNAFASVQAWRTTTFVLSGLLAFGSVQFVRLANEQNVLLVPQGLALGSKAVMVNLGEPFSPDYVAKVAEMDAHFLLDWSPENVEQQYGVFASRLTPDMYAKKAPALLDEAKQNRADGVSQSFYRSRESISGHTVTLYGVLVRNQGGKEVFRGPATYLFDYSNAGNGLLNVAGVSQPADPHAADNKTAKSAN